MSYWGAQVIISLFGAIPLIGESLALWIRGDYVISDATLNRFFAFHVIALPLLLFAVIYLHIAALHTVGSNNPDGVEIKANKNPDGTPVDGIPFHPYYTVKDIFGLAVFLTIFMFVVFFMPEFGGFFLEKDNFVPADPLKTPEHKIPNRDNMLRCFKWISRNEIIFFKEKASEFGHEKHHEHENSKENSKAKYILNSVVRMEWYTIYWSAVRILICFYFNTIWIV